MVSLVMKNCAFAAVAIKAAKAERVSGLLGDVDTAVNTGCRARTRREEEGIQRLVVDVVAERDAPDALLLDHRAIDLSQRADECTGRRVERTDGAVAEIADQQVIACTTEIRRRHGDAPGRIQG